MTGSGTLRSSSGRVPPAAAAVVVVVPALDEPPLLPHAARATVTIRTSAILMRATDDNAGLLGDGRAQEGTAQPARGRSASAIGSSTAGVCGTGRYTMPMSTPAAANAAAASTSGPTPLSTS